MLSPASVSRTALATLSLLGSLVSVSIPTPVAAQTREEIGLVLDPNTRAMVKAVEPGSPIDEAGWRTGDRIQRLNGQPMLSMADVQWVLNQIPAEGGELAAEITRDGEPARLRLELSDGWRSQGDLSWRASSWGLRRMVTGGLRLEAADERERQRLGVPDDRMALFVTHVGQYGPHATAKRAGFQVDDVIVEYEGRRDLMTDSELLAYGATETHPGSDIRITVLRDGTEKMLRMPAQK